MNIKLERFVFPADMRCRAKGLQKQVPNTWWEKKMKPGSLVLYVNRSRKIVSFLNHQGVEVRKQFDSAVDLDAMRGVLLEAFGLDIGVNRTFQQKWAAYLESKKWKGVKLGGQSASKQMDLF